MTKLLRGRYTWLIIALLGVAVLLAYPVERYILSGLPPETENHEVYMILLVLRSGLLLIAVGIAAWRFKVRGGLAVCLVIVPILLPHIISEVSDPIGMNVLVLYLYGVGTMTGIALSWIVGKHKQAEDALQASERWLWTTLRSISDAVIATDAKGYVILMNPVAQTLTGWNEEDAAGKPLKDVFNIINEQTGKQAENPVTRVIREGVVVGLANHTVLIAKDGSKRPVDDSGAPIRDGKGNITGVILVFRDITERKRAEREIRGLAKFPSENPNPVLRVAKNGTILYANQASSPLLNAWGCEIGKSFPDHLHQTILGVLREDSPKDVEIECGEQAFSFLFVPIVEVDYVNLYGRDITLRKQAKEREKELQAELNHSSRLAAIGELAAGVAHEINNPLTGILGFSELLLNKSTDKETSQRLERIHSEAKRAAKVVENLLTFARRREPKREYGNINDILQRALELRAYELKTVNIKVTVKLAPDLPQVTVDPLQIQEVFLNIILNAEHAIIEANGEGKLNIQTQQIKDFIRVSFADDGPGIPVEQLGKLFNPFFTTRGDEGGTGLGLSICHGIVTEHRGKIYARSKPGRGTTFFVELPIRQEE